MELYLAWHRQGRPSVKYDLTEVSITVTAIVPVFGLQYQVSEWLTNDSMEEDGKHILQTLTTGAMVRLSHGTLQLADGCIDAGSVFFLRQRANNVLHLFDSKENARNQKQLAGVYEIVGGIGAQLDVVCPLHDRIESKGRVRFVQNQAYVSCSGEVLREINQDGETWVQVGSLTALEQPQGWVGPLRKGCCGPLRVTRPFPLALYMYCLQYDAFVGDAVSRFEMLLEFKPDQQDKAIMSEDVDKDANGLLTSYRLRFRERSWRNAYWRTIQNRLQGRIALESSSASGNEPWTQYAGTTLRIGNTISTCLVHIWDQPR